VFGLSRALAVWVYTEPTDMRKSFNTLSALVTEEMHREVLSGDLFVFISRDRKRAKVLHFDGTGLIVWATTSGRTARSEDGHRTNSPRDSLHGWTDFGGRLM
jgi:transposase